MAQIAEAPMNYISNTVKAVREKIGIRDNLIRLSVGIENVDYLIDDLETAFQS